MPKNLAAQKIHFSALPEEVIQRVLFFCNSDDVDLNVQRVCRRLYRIANEPLLWRYYCELEYRYWDSRHHINEKLLYPIDLVDWRSLYRYRRMVDAKTTKLLNSILQTQLGRISKYETISSFGFDAKENLIRHINTDDHVHDALARRYYATSVLDFLHRAIALEEWQKVFDDNYVPIERAMGCFDLFVLQDRIGDFSEISNMFDELIKKFRLEYHNVESLTSRAKALSLIEFMRKYNLTGPLSHWAHKRMQSYYIGLFLQDPKYPPIPVLSITILCALGERINLDIRCCGLPNYIAVIVFPRPGEKLDGEKLKDGERDGVPMYIDPYRFMKEIPLPTLKQNLSNLGIHHSRHMEFLSDMSISNVIQRMSKTLLATAHQLRAHDENLLIDGQSLMEHSNFSTVDIEKAHYSALWADLMFAGRSRQHTLEIQQNLLIPVILEMSERIYPMDTCLIEKHILPFYDDPQNPTSSQTYSQIVEALHAIRVADRTPKEIRSRYPLAKQKIKYKIGQVFCHKRYHYSAVICGWALEGETDIESVSVRSNFVNSVSSERYKSFYHALVEDASIRYVAEENIEVIQPEFPISLMNLAGRYFKRWDIQSHTFISGIKDEYPED